MHAVIVETINQSKMLTRTTLSRCLVQTTGSLLRSSNLLSTSCYCTNGVITNHSSLYQNISCYSTDSTLGSSKQDKDVKKIRKHTPSSPRVKTNQYQYQVKQEKRDYSGVEEEHTDDNTKITTKKQDHEHMVKEKERKNRLAERAPEDRTLSQKAYFEKLTKLGRYDEAKELYRYMGDKRGTIYAFENLLLACAESGKFNESWRVYNDLKRAGLKPTVYVLGHLVNVCTSCKNIGDDAIKQRLDMVIEEIEKHDVKLSVKFFNILMKTMIRVGDYQGAISFIEKMKEAGMRPDIATYSTLVVGLSERYKALVDFDQNKRTLMKTLASSHNYQELDQLRADGLKQIEQYTAIIQELKRNNVTPDRVFVNTLLHACKQTNYPEGVFDVYASLKEMKFTHNLQSDTRTYDILVSTCNYTNNIDKGLELFEEIIVYNIRPDINLINNLYRLALRITYIKQDNVYDVDLLIERIIKLMERYKILPDATTFTVLIPTYSRMKKMNKVYELLLEMKEMGFKPTIKDYTGVMIGVQDDMDKVMNVFNVIKSQNTRLTPEFIHFLLNIVKKRGSADQLEVISSGIRYLEQINTTKN